MDGKDLDTATHALDRANEAKKTADKLEGELKQAVEGLRSSWARDIRELHDDYNGKCDRLDELIRGDGNGIKGLAPRTASIEAAIRRLTFWLRAVGVAVISLAGKIVYDIVRSGMAP